MPIYVELVQSDGMISHFLTLAPEPLTLAGVEWSKSASDHLSALWWVFPFDALSRFIDDHLAIRTNNTDYTTTCHVQPALFQIRLEILSILTLFPHTAFTMAIQPITGVRISYCVSQTEAPRLCRRCCRDLSANYVLVGRS